MDFGVIAKEVGIPQGEAQHLLNFALDVAITSTRDLNRAVLRRARSWRLS